MRRSAGLLLLIILLAAGNAAVVQGVAWVGMLVQRSQTMGWQGAVASTFSGRQPCRMCLAAAALRDERSPGQPTPEIKVMTSFLALATDPPVISGPACRHVRPLPHAIDDMPPGFRLQPLPPPPRRS